MEKQHHTNSRFRRLTRCLEPLVEFLIMYSPAVDMIVQYDVNPSALVWGSLKTIIKIAQNSIKYYSFIERMLIKLADIFSFSARYHKLFGQEERVRSALTDLYLELLIFLQRIRATISAGGKFQDCHEKDTLMSALMLLLAFKVLARSIFRSVDVDFHDNVQRLSRMTKVFEEEITFAHRQHIEDHLKEQRSANSTVDRRLVQSEQKLMTLSERGVQGGSCLWLPSSCQPLLVWN